MARVTQTAGQDYSGLADDVWYDLTLKSIEPVAAEYATFGPATRFTFAFDAYNGDLTMPVNATNKIGRTKAGQASKLRAIAGAITNHPTIIAPTFWEDELYIMGYPGVTPASPGSEHPIKPGAKLQGRGEFVVGEDGTSRFYLTAFRPGGILQAASTTAETVAPVAASAEAIAAAPF